MDRHMDMAFFLSEAALCCHFISNRICSDYVVSFKYYVNMQKQRSEYNAHAPCEP